LKELFEVIEGMFKKSPQKLRAATLRKWAHVFDESFYNHLSGDVGFKSYKIFNNKWLRYEDWIYLSEYGEGGHFINRFLSIDELIYPEGLKTIEKLTDDTPFIAKVIVKSKYGKRFPKINTSSMFPKNWSLERIQEEVAWVYENTVAKGVHQLRRAPNDKFTKYQFKSTVGFDIRIEVNDIGNITNAYPLLF